MMMMMMMMMMMLIIIVISIVIIITTIFITIIFICIFFCWGGGGGWDCRSPENSKAASRQQPEIRKEGSGAPEKQSWYFFGTSNPIITISGHLRGLQVGYKYSFL